MALKDKREDESNELIDGMSLRQFILNEDSFAKTTLTATLPGSLKKSTFLTIFMGIAKEFIEKYKKFLFPLATAITFYETRQAWNNYKKKHNQNFAAKWDLFMTFAMAAKEATAVIIALAFTTVSALIAPLMFLIMIGRNVVNSLAGVCGNLWNMWKLRDKTFSAQYVAEKEALKNNLDNFFVSATLWVGILTSFLAPQFAAAFSGLIAASYAISMTTVGVLAASTARSIYNTVTSFFGWGKSKNNPRDHKDEYVNKNNFNNLKESHIDDLLLKLKFLNEKSPNDAKDFLKNLIKDEKLSIVTGGLNATSETREANTQKLNALDDLLKIISNPTDKSVAELVTEYRNNQILTNIMTSDESNKNIAQKIMTTSANETSNMQKLFVMVDEWITNLEEYNKVRSAGMIDPPSTSTNIDDSPELNLEEYNKVRSAEMIDPPSTSTNIDDSSELNVEKTREDNNKTFLGLPIVDTSPALPRQTGIVKINIYEEQRRIHEEQRGKIIAAVYQQEPTSSLKLGQYQ